MPRAAVIECDACGEQLLRADAIDSDDEEAYQCVDCGDLTCCEPGYCGEMCNHCGDRICDTCSMKDPNCIDCIAKLKRAAKVILRVWRSAKWLFYLRRYVATHKALVRLPVDVTTNVVLPMLGYVTGRISKPKREVEDDEDQPRTKRQRKK